MLQPAVGFRVNLRRAPVYGLFSLGIKTLTGRRWDIPPSMSTMSVLELKQLIQDKEGIPPDSQRLIAAPIKAKGLGPREVPIFHHGGRSFLSRPPCCCCVLTASLLTAAASPTTAWITSVSFIR
jgi:hypothetical protein